MAPPVTVSFEWWRRPPDEPAFDRGRAEDALTDSRPGAKTSFVALVVFTVILVAAPQDFVPILGKLRIALVAAVVAIVAQLRGGWRRPFLLHTPAEVQITGALVLLAVLTVPIAIWPGGAFQTLTDLYLKSVVIFWLLGRVVDSEARLRVLLRTLALLSVPVALTAVRHYLAGDFQGGRVVAYGGSLASNPNDLALTLAIFIPTTVALAMTAPKALERSAMWGIAALDSVAIVLTFSRGGFLALALEVLLLMSVMFRRGAGWIAAGVLTGTLVGVAVVPSGYQARLSTILDINSDPTSSAQERWRDMVVATTWVAEHPIVGVGLGNDILALNQARGNRWLTVHDTYLNYGMDLGLPGMLLFVVLLGRTLWSATRVDRAARAAGRRALGLLAAGIAISLAGFALAGFFFPLAYHFSFYYLAGLAVALRTIAARGGLPGYEGSRR